MRSAGGAATRGIILIVVAIIIGVVLIANGVDKDESISTVTASTTSTSTTTTLPEESDTSDTTVQSTVSSVAPPVETTVGTSTTPPPPGDLFTARAPNIVTVQVANTTRVGGAAGRMTKNIASGGYDMSDAATANSGVQTETKILHITGYLLAAQALAEFLQLDPQTSVDSMPPNPGAAIDDFLDPHLLVLLGSDLAISP